MQFRRLPALGLAAILAFAAVPALAQAPDIGKVFKAWDLDSDGFLTPAEWAKAGREEEGFKRVDRDQDGKVSLEELKAAVARMRSGG